MLLRIGIVVALLCGAGGAQTSAGRETERMAATVRGLWPAGVVATTRNPGTWSYEEGVLLDGFAAQWGVTHDAADLAYIRAAVDKYVGEDGVIRMGPDGRAFPTEQHSLDNVEMGRAVLFLFRQTHVEKYGKAAKFLHGVLEEQPRNASGGYWHKGIYPNQMWLDGAYMAEPFRAEYAATLGNDDWGDIAKQFLLMRSNMYDARSELLRHGWDEGKQMGWADKTTGLSPEIWARAMGWYCVALVDVLDWLPVGNPARAPLVHLLHETLVNVGQYQDVDTGLWWQVMDKGPAITGTLDARARIHFRVDRAAAEGNFVEASASAMFVYAIAKAVRMGYLPGVYRKDAERGWTGIRKRFVRVGAGGVPTLTGTVKAAGLGGTPYRSGSYSYYISEPTGENDAKGVGAYLLAGSEMERMGAKSGRRGVRAGGRGVR